MTFGNHSMSSSQRGNAMNRSATIVLSLTALLCLPPALAFAQNAPPTYEADPSVYKIIFEDQNFRVIASTWKAGVTDKSHPHTAPSAAIFLTSSHYPFSP